MPRLVLGPLLRSPGADHISVWVETDGPCTVSVLGHRSPTFAVWGHHYALVDVQGLEPGVEHRYDVRLDDEVAWPPPGSPLPPPAIRLWRPGQPFRLAMGSCQQAAPHHPPWALPSGRDPRGLGPDALRALARRLAATDADRPHVLLLLGDQVYADEPNPATVEGLRRRRGGPPPPRWPEVASFEEYTWLYQQAWGCDPLLRWLLASVPSLMVFDDHDVIDDWNTSRPWRRRVEQAPWWSGRIRGALMTYWLYQHLGNTRLAERADDELLDRVRRSRDGGRPLHELAARADVGTPGGVGHRWSYRHDLGPCRLVVIDSRNGRVLEEEDRSMLDPVEWAWLDEQATGDIDHLLVGTSVPWLLPRPIHDLEAWDEQVAEGAWGRRLAAFGEWLRQGVDLEHWAAFGSSFHRLADILGSVARGDRGAPPATVLALSGDVHFGYVAEADLDRAVSRVRQVVTSPLRQASPLKERRAQQLAMRPPVSLLPRALVLTTPAARPRFRWRVSDGPWFPNHLATITLEGRQAHLCVEQAELDEHDDAALTPVCQRPL